MMHIFMKSYTYRSAQGIKAIPESVKQKASPNIFVEPPIIATGPKSSSQDILLQKRRDDETHSSCNMFLQKF